MAARTKKKPASKEPSAKVIAMPLNKNTFDEKQTVLQQAANAEKNNDLELAEELYTKQLQQKTFNPPVYTRLMIVLRKQKKYKDELEIINKGLQHFRDQTSERLTKKAGNTTIKKLSDSLNKSLGLVDKKGNAFYEPAPIPTWRKRKITVEKKLKKQ
ncbi:MAG: hypothetical protein JO072_05195 [Parafilimonas sp.]|nr:hypothetical protein [Parafilimonas sp.]